MLTDQQLWVLVAVVAGALVLVSVLVSWWLTTPRRSGRPQSDLQEERERGEGEVRIDFAAGYEDPRRPRPILATPTYNRVVRTLSFALLVSALVAVGAGGQWAENAAAIYVLVAVATVFLVIVQDVIPAQWLGRARYVVDAIGALAFVTALNVLTGGFESPFVFGYFLIAALAAFAGSARTAVLVASTAVVVHGGVIGWLLGPITSPQFVRLAFNLLALVLITALAHVVGMELRRARDSALRLSIVDPLTGLFNRAHLLTLVEREIRRAARTGRRFCLVMLDLDDLKPVNDTFGHQYGDRILCAVGDVLRGSVRGIDAAARYGGDEFIVLLPETDPTGAYVLAEKLRLAINDLTVRVNGRTVRSSASIGVVTFPEDGTDAAQLIASADAAMYEAKRLGKNKMVSYRREPVDAALPRTGEIADLERPRAAPLGETEESLQGVAYFGGAGRPGEARGRAQARIAITPLDPSVAEARASRRFEVVRLQDEPPAGPPWATRPAAETLHHQGGIDQTE